MGVSRIACTRSGSDWHTQLAALDAAVAAEEGAKPHRAYGTCESVAGADESDPEASDSRSETVRPLGSIAARSVESPAAEGCCARIRRLWPGTVCEWGLAVLAMVSLAWFGWNVAGCVVLAVRRYAER